MEISSVHAPESAKISKIREKAAERYGKLDNISLSLMKETADSIHKLISRHALSREEVRKSHGFLFDGNQSSAAESAAVAKVRAELAKSFQ